MPTRARLLAPETLDEKAAERELLERQIADFLARGNAIKRVRTAEEQAAVIRAVNGGKLLPTEDRAAAANRRRPTCSGQAPLPPRPAVAAKAEPLPPPPTVERASEERRALLLTWQPEPFALPPAWPPW